MMMTAEPSTADVVWLYATFRVRHAVIHRFRCHLPACVATFKTSLSAVVYPRMRRMDYCILYLAPQSDLCPYDVLVTPQENGHTHQCPICLSFHCIRTQSGCGLGRETRYCDRLAAAFCTCMGVHSLVYSESDLDVSQCPTEKFRSQVRTLLHSRRRLSRQVPLLRCLCHQ